MQALWGVHVHGVERGVQGVEGGEVVVCGEPLSEVLRHVSSVRCGGVGVGHGQAHLVEECAHTVGGVGVACLFVAYAGGRGEEGGEVGHVIKLMS